MKIPTKIDCGSIWATDEVRGSFFSSAVCRCIYNYAFCKRFPHLSISLSKRVGWCLQVKWFFGEWPFFIAETGRWLKSKLIFQSVHLIHFQKVQQCIFMGGPASPKISLSFWKTLFFLSQVIDLRNWSRSFSLFNKGFRFLCQGSWHGYFIQSHLTKLRVQLKEWNVRCWAVDSVVYKLHIDLNTLLLRTAATNLWPSFLFLQTRMHD